MSDTIRIGQAVRHSCNFKAGTNNTVDTDPTTVSLAVKNPAGTLTTYTYAAAEITKDSTGNYHKDITMAAAGRHSWKWTGTGTVASPDEGEFIVADSQFD